MEKDWPLRPKFGEKNIFSRLSELNNPEVQDAAIHTILESLDADNFQTAIYSTDHPYKALVSSHINTCDSCHNKQATIANERDRHNRHRAD